MPLLQVTHHQTLNSGTTQEVPALLGTDIIESVYPATHGSLVVFRDGRTMRLTETPAELWDLYLGAPPGDPPKEFDAWRYHSWSSPGGVYQGFFGHYDSPSYGDTVTVAGLEIDEQGAVIGMRPVAVFGDRLIMACDSWSVDGLQLPANTDGYSLQVLPDGKSVVALPNPPPGYSLEARGTTDHDMSLFNNTWIKITADSVAATSQIPSGSTGTYALRFHDRDVRGGTMDVAGGLDGNPPAGAPDDSFSIGPGAQAYKTGFIPVVSTISIGQTIALWARVQNAHANADIWVEGSIQDSIIDLSTT